MHSISYNSKSEHIISYLDYRPNVDEKQHLLSQQYYARKSFIPRKIPAGRSATFMELPTYDHDPELKFGDDQILIL